MSKLKNKQSLISEEFKQQSIQRWKQQLLASSSMTEFQAQRGAELIAKIAYFITGLFAFFLVRED